MGLLLKKYLWVFYLLMVAASACFLAKISATFIAESIAVDYEISVPSIVTRSKESHRVARLNNYKIIVDRNIFDSREIELEHSPESAPGMPIQGNLDGPAVLTSLPIKLISTFSIGDGTSPKATATIINSQGGSGQPDVYRVGGETQFSPGVNITKILPDRIEFVNNGRLEYVPLEGFETGGGKSTPLHLPVGGNGPVSSPSNPSGDVRAVGGNKFVVDQAKIDDAFSKLDVLFTQIQIGPHIVAGKPQGIRINRMSNQSIFADLGLTRGDVLKKINGEDIDMTKGMLLLGQLKNQKEFSLDIERRGQKMTMEYEIR